MIGQWSQWNAQPIVPMLHAIERHDAEQRAEIESLSRLLDCANKELLERAKEIERLREALAYIGSGEAQTLTEVEAVARHVLLQALDGKEPS